MTQTVALPSRIEDKLDRAAAGAVMVHGGGVAFTSMNEVMEFSKLMALSGIAVRPHLRLQPGACLGVVMQAIDWQMQPFAVANKSYAVNDQLGFESQLLHAVVEARAPITGRLRCVYDGKIEDGTRTCTVSATFKGENEPHSYTSPQISKIRVKNSPLWRDDPDQQLFYFASRSWSRKWCPDVLLGVYTPEELQSLPVGENARAVEDFERVDNPLGGDDEHFDPGTGEVVQRGGGAAFGSSSTAGIGGGNAGSGASSGFGGNAGGGGGAFIDVGGNAGAPTAGEGNHSVGGNGQGSGSASPGAAQAQDGASPKATRSRKTAAKPAGGPPPESAGAESASQPAKTQQNQGPNQGESGGAESGGDPEVFPQPWIKQSSAAYVAYALRWIEKEEGAISARKRWTDERAIRNGLSGPLDDKQLATLQTAMGKLK